MIIVRYLFCLLIIPILSCIVEKHEEVWFFEWRLLNSADSLPVVNANLTCHINYYPASCYITDDTITFPVDSSGYIFDQVYSEYPNDFLEKNPFLTIRVYDSSKEYLSATLYWNDMVFGDQKFDSPHYDHGNTYILYDTNAVTRNINKRWFYITYP